MKQSKTLTAEDTIERLVVLSPYWDEDLAALNELQEQLRPRETLLLVQAKNALLPITPLASLKNTRILDIGPQHKGRFIHAKLLLAQGVNFEHALFGSANCTTAALGRLAFKGSNHEACLYRRVGVGEISSAINLEKLIANAESTSASTLPAYSPVEEVPLSELDRNDPGTFECGFEKLTWRPTSRFNSDEVMIELFSGGRASLSCSPEPIPSGVENERFFAMSGLTERPVFARVVDSHGTPSGFAIVTLTDALRVEIRETGQPALERAVQRLGIETEEGLWLNELWETFEVAADADSISSSHRQSLKRDANVPESVFTQLDYASFVANCRLRSSVGSTVTRNSLAGTPLSSVRAFLNRVLDISDIDEKKVESDDGRSFENAFDLGDDVDDGQDAVEQGEIFGKKDGDITRTEDPKNNKVLRMKGQNRKKIESAVGQFMVRVGDVSKNGALTSVELLRLRCMLAIVFVAGLPLPHRKKEQDSEQSILQVLPATGQEPTWPRLLGQLLFSVFGGPHPPISRLKVEDIHDRIPDDFIECWAYCFWAIHARIIATPENSFHQDLLRRIYELSKLPPEDRQSERLATVMSRLDDRFAKRLGLTAGAVLKAHLNFS